MTAKLIALATSVAACAALMTLLGGCSTSNTLGTDYSQTGIVPLAVGNSWTYVVSSYDSIPGVTTTDSMTLSVPADSVMFGKRFYLLYGAHYVTNTDSGLIKYNGTHDNFVDFRMYYQYPTVRGATFSWLQAGSAYVESVDTLVSVVAGSFHCIHYQIRMHMRPYEDDYVCPNIGLVKRITYIYFPYPLSAELRGTSTSELQRYTLKK